MLVMSDDKDNNKDKKKGSLIDFTEVNIRRQNEWVVVAFNKHKESLKQFLFKKTGSEQDASDLVQDTFIRLMRYDDPSRIENINAFIYTTASNLFRDKLRRNSVRQVSQHIPLENYHSVSSEDKLESACLSSENIGLLIAALKELEPEYRKALIMHKFHDKSHAEIAKTLDTTIGVVRRYINVALLHCRRKVEPLE